MRKKIFMSSLIIYLIGMCCLFCSGCAQRIDYNESGIWDTETLEEAVNQADDLEVVYVTPEWKSVYMGDAVMFQVQARSSKEVSYQWYTESEGDRQPIENANEAYYSIVVGDRSADYVCIVTDESGHFVKMPFTAYGYLFTNLTIEVTENDDGTFTMEAVLDGLREGAEVTYQWRESVDRDISGANGKTYTVPYPEKGDPAYTCRVTAKYKEYEHSDSDMCELIPCIMVLD